MTDEHILRKPPDYTLLATVGALIALGLVMVYSASFVEAFTLHQTQFYYLLRQFIGSLIGLTGLLIAWRLDYTIWRRFSVHLMGLALVLLVLVLVLPTSMTMVNGSRSWIRFNNGLLSVQPSEIAKLAVIVYFADWLSRRGSKLGNVTYGLIPFAVMLGLVCGLVMMEPDRGTTAVILVIAVVVYFAAGANLLHILAAAVLGVAVVWGMFHLVDWHQNGRIQAFLDPWQYYNTYGYQPIHALYALGSGGVFGMGLGQARQKFQWLPQAHTDSIFAIVGEELGLIGTMLVVLAFLLIAYRGYRIACRVRDPFAALVAVGITSWLVFQAFLNIAVTTSLVPFTGLTLPFMSYGSTSLIMCMVSTGILLNISQYVEAPQADPQPTASHSWRSPALEFFQQTGQLVRTWSGWRAGGGKPSARRSIRPSVVHPTPRPAEQTERLVLPEQPAQPAQRPASRARGSGQRKESGRSKNTGRSKERNSSHVRDKRLANVAAILDSSQRLAAAVSLRWRDGWARLSGPRRSRGARSGRGARFTPTRRR